MRRGLLLIGCLCACQRGFSGSDEQLAHTLAKELSVACPMAPADDEKARSVCAQKLTDLSLLREQMNDPFLWGQQEDAGTPMMVDSVTRFNPLVWRRLYLSTYMFPKDYTVEKTADGRTLLTIAARFRNKLDMGSYPYPFWHRPGKWLAYEKAQGLVFAIKNGKLLGSVRTWDGTEGRFTVPQERPEVFHEWGGQWSWTLGEEEYPKATLYTWLLSTENPHRQKLEDAFRDLEHEMRKTTCFMCHSPDNATQMAQLELFSYPNQALTGRHRIVTALQNNTMPVSDAKRGIEAGYHGAQDATRQKLLELAKTFAKLGDEALRFEGERVP